MTNPLLLELEIAKRYVPEGKLSASPGVHFNLY